MKVDSVGSFWNNFNFKFLDKLHNKELLYSIVSEVVSISFIAETKEAVRFKVRDSEFTFSNFLVSFCFMDRSSPSCYADYELEIQYFFTLDFEVEPYKYKSEYKKLITDYVNYLIDREIKKKFGINKHTIKNKHDSISYEMPDKYTKRINRVYHLESFNKVDIDFLYMTIYSMYIQHSYEEYTKDKFYTDKDLDNIKEDDYKPICDLLISLKLFNSSSPFANEKKIRKIIKLWKENDCVLSTELSEEIELLYST